MLCLGALVAAVAPARAATAAPVGAPCARKQLPAPPGLRSVTLDAGESSDRYQAGSARDADERLHLVRWQDSVPADLGSEHAGATDINEDGAMVGAEFDVGLQGYRGWRHRDGRFSELPPPRPGFDSLPVAMNRAGQVAGRAMDLGTSDFHAVAWSADGTVRELPIPPADNNTVAADIDEDGTIVGYSYFDRHDTSPFTTRAVVWSPDGSWRILPGAGIKTGSDVGAAAIRDGVIVGTEIPTSGDQPSLVLQWQVDGGGPSVRHSELAGRSLSVHGVNRRGSILLQTLSSGPALLQEDLLRPLPIDDPMMGGASLAAVSDDDVAFGADNSGADSLPVRWDCRL